MGVMMAKAFAIKFIVIRKFKKTENICRFYCRQWSNQPEAHRKDAELSFIFKCGILIFRFHGNMRLRATYHIPKQNEFGKQVRTIEIKVFADFLKKKN